ncbi:hypothetical protein BDF21DRAFT_462919 [Thamnidium elegans]|nr:hypothetical protein BDF21DRAFT_462919 [Thamnidium elegans]
MNNNNNKNNKKQVPEWSLQLTEQLMNNNHVAPLPSAIIIHSEDKDEQFQKYIDRQFTLNEANVLKNQLSGIPVSAARSSPSARSPLNQHNNNITEEQEKNAWWLSKNDQDGFYSICGLFFLFGFLFPPFWWIGSVWPKNVAERGGKMAERWQKLNRIMSIGFSSILLILIIVFVILYTTTN